MQASNSVVQEAGVGRCIARARPLLLLLLLSALSLQPLCASEEVSLPPGAKQVPLHGVTIYIDHTAQEELANVAARREQFHPLDTPPVAVPGHATAWFRFTLDNRTADVVSRVLVVGSRQSERNRLWVQSGGEWQAVAEIDSREWHNYPSSPSPQPYFQLTVRSGTTEYLLAVQHRTFGYVGLTLWHPQLFWERISDDNSLIAFFVALCLAMAAYNLALFFSMREVMYLYYAGYIFFGTLFFPLRDLYYSSWFGLDLLGLLSIRGTGIIPLLSLTAATLLLALYAFRFLGLSFSRPWEKALRIVVLACPILFWLAEAVQLILPHSSVVSERLIFTQNLSLMCFSLLLLGVIAHAAIAGSDRIRGQWLLGSLGIALTGAVFEILRLMGYLSDAFRHSVHTGVALEIVVLTLYMSHRINQLRRDKLAAQQAVYDARDREAERLEREVTERTRQLDQKINELAESNAAKDKFFSIISHDLRGPIGNLHVVLNMARSNQLELDEELLHELTEGTGNTYNLLDDLLTWARSQKGQLEKNAESFHLSLMVHSAAVVAADQARNKGIELHYAVDDSVYAHADITMFCTVLRNLLSNAIKFTPSGGRVAVGGVVQQDGVIRISVKDNGVGISREKGDKLFQLGEQMASSMGTAQEKGTGLGLLLCKEFAEKNGGAIGFDSTPGEGSEFWFTLPQGTLAQQPVVESLQQMDGNWHGLSTLLVEDNRINREAHQRVLSGMGIAAQLAISGTEAIRAAAEKYFELILMDIDLPEVSGIEATHHIRNNGNHDAHVVALSSFTRSELAQIGADIFDGYLEKPLNAERLSQLLGELRAPA